ncbi:MAG TPA: EpsG family protein [Rectinemataceae bacterium]|nr:EpsG family protein [Rectinemataceae bacterium]
MIYFIVFGALAILSILEAQDRLGRARLPLLGIAAVFFVSFAGLKWGRGTDWPPYLSFFGQSLPGTPWYAGSFEPGYVVWNRLIAAIWANYSFYMTVTASLCVAAIMAALRKNKALTFVALAVLFANTLVAFSLTRQTIAGSLVLLAFSFLAERRRVPFVLLVILAASFHVTAFFALSALALDREVGPMAIAIIFATLLAFSFLGAWRAGLDFVGRLLPMGHVRGRIQDYLGSTSGFGLTATAFREILGPAKHLILFAALAYYRFGRLKEDRSYRFFFNVYSFGVAIYLATTSDLLVFQRVFWYFNPAQAFLVPAILKSESGRRKTLLGVFLIGYFGILFYFTLRSYWGEYVPYASILSLPRIGK